MSKIKIPPIFPGVDYVYAVLAQEKAGPLYVKFGKSSSLAKRFGQLRTGSPIPVRYYAFVEVRDDEQQTEVEQALHQRFADRRVNGEWFKFDANSTEDKRDFNDGCTEVFLAFIGPGESWSKVSAANLPLSLQERRRIEKNSAIAFAMMHINSDYPGRTNDFYYEDQSSSNCPVLRGFFVSGDPMSFRPAVNFVLKEEGGYIFDKRDPGGETKYGISKRSYPDLDIKSLTVDDATAIYYRDCWSKLPKLPEPVDFLVFDCAVNCGVNRAIRLLQTAVGTEDDGIWGPMSQSMLDRAKISQLVVNYQAERARYYALLDDLDDVYARGWMRRTMRAFKEAISE